MDIPHCPNPACRCFHEVPESSWYIRYGRYHTDAFGNVQRFRCKGCGVSFSTQTFSIDYYAKRIIDYDTLVEHLVSASGILDLGRKLNARAETIENRFERLSRCAVSIHGELLKVLPMDEDMAADGFESFSYSQYYPNDVNLIVGSSSEFIYAMGLSVLRRKGRMSERQREKRRRLELKGKADRKAVEESMYHILEDITQRLSRKGVRRKVLFSDERAAYARAVRRIKEFPEHFVHVRIPSGACRTQGKPLFAVSYVDRQIRKDLCDHVRETVQFAKCPSALMSRLSVYRFYHNCCIPRRVRASRRGEDETHAQRAGVSAREQKAIIERYWKKRCFLLQQDLDREERKTWMCGWRNPGVAYGRYIPQYIAA